MVSHPFGCFMLIWSVAVERSVRVSGVSFVFPKTSSLLMNGNRRLPFISNEPSKIKALHEICQLAVVI